MKALDHKKPDRGPRHRQTPSTNLPTARVADDTQYYPARGTTSCSKRVRVGSYKTEVPQVLALPNKLTCTDDASRNLLPLNLLSRQFGRSAFVRRSLVFCDFTYLRNLSFRETTRDTVGLHQQGSDIVRKYDCKGRFSVAPRFKFVWVRLVPPGQMSSWTAVCVSRLRKT
jgi:hypothetical protein